MSRRATRAKFVHDEGYNLEPRANRWFRDHLGRALCEFGFADKCEPGVAPPVCRRVPLKCVRGFHVAVQERLRSMLTVETPTSVFAGEAREWITAAMEDTQHMSMDERGGTWSSTCATCSVTCRPCWRILCGPWTPPPRPERRAGPSRRGPGPCQDGRAGGHVASGDRRHECHVPQQAEVRVRGS